VLPSEVGDPIRPLKIGVRDDLAALLPNGEGHEVLAQVLRRYVRAWEYLAALAVPDAMRYALDGTPVEPVAEEHQVPIRPIPQAVPSPASRPE
jgi:sRNA-binding protein